MVIEAFFEVHPLICPKCKTPLKINVYEKGGN